MWHLTLRIREDGGAEITSLSGGVPAGEIDLRGADDGELVLLEARQRDPAGRSVISAFRRIYAAETPRAEDTGDEDSGPAITHVDVTGERL